MLRTEAAKYERAISRGSGATWLDWLSVMAFDHLQRAYTMYGALLSDDIDIAEHLVEVVEEYLFCPPAYPAEDYLAACMDRWDELERMPYADYLQSREWRERRQAVLHRFRHRCAVCNSPDALQIHHRTYERRGSEKPTDLVCLCADCHGAFHERRGNGSRGLAR